MNKTIFRKIYSCDYGATGLSDSESQLSRKVLVYTQLTRYTFAEVSTYPICESALWKQRSAKCASMRALKLFALVK